MFGTERSSRDVRRNASFDLPVRRRRDRSYRVEPGSFVFTCFTSDFLVEQADAWRPEAWDIIRRRRDCRFLFFTKRIERLAALLPEDWGDGWDNVIVGCTVENREMAGRRLPVFLDLPLRHRAIIAAPLLEPLDLSPYLGPAVEEVSAGGESGAEARICDYDWVLDIRRQCMDAGVAFRFHQTGARFVKDGRLYRIPRRCQISQAARAGIDCRAEGGISDGAASVMPAGIPGVFEFPD